MQRHDQDAITIADARSHFERIGKLYKCPNAAHEFQFGRVLGQWQWAADRWSTLNSQGHLITHWFNVGKVENVDGLVFYKIIIGKLALSFGVVDKPA